MVATDERDNEFQNRHTRYALVKALTALQDARSSAQEFDSCDEFVVRLTTVIDDVQKLKDIHLRNRGK